MDKKISIMQPYFLPYIGYWQMLNYADEFVVYDNIEYTKKGWINRNQFLNHNEPKYFTLPLAKASDFAYINNRQLASIFDKKKLLNQIKSAYQKAPNFKETFELIEEILQNPEQNLFDYILNSIASVTSYLDINTKIIKSSEIPNNHLLKSQDRVINISKALLAHEYINPISGAHLYNAKTFEDNGIQLNFLQPTLNEYKQKNNEFVPALSILDMLMFCGKEYTKQQLKAFSLSKEEIKRTDCQETILFCLEKFNTSSPASISSQVGDLKIYAKKLHENATTYCTYRNNEITGIVSLYANNPSFAFMTLLYVDDALKGCKIGSKLLNKAINHTRQNGIKNLKWEVHKNNINAIEFYTSKGAKIENETPRNTILMNKEV